MGRALFASAVRASATAHAAEVAGYAALAKYVVLVTLLLLVVMLQLARACLHATRGTMSNDKGFVY